MAQRILVWDLATRIFHWSLVVSFFGAYLTADSGFRYLHVMFGYTVFGLILFRLLWGFIGPRYARFLGFVKGPVAIFLHVKHLLTGKHQQFIGHNPAGAVAVVLLLLMGLVSTVTGKLSYNEPWKDWMEELHELSSLVMLLVVFVHVVGTLAMSFVDRQNLVLSMITGKKTGESDQAIPGSRPLAGLTLLVVIIAFWILALPGNPLKTYL